MSETKHPPVLPVGKMFIRRDDCPTIGWQYAPPFTGVGYATQHAINYTTKDMRRIIAALQQCAWDDLRTEENEAEIRLTLITAGIDAGKMSRREMEEACRAKKADWAAWEKEGA